jgi:putative flavoprotein involved in K+ transport
MAEYATIVVGAGQAGLAASHHLRARGIEHVVLERGRIGESWRSQRWDSFAVNTPNWLNALPGEPYAGDEPDGFFQRDELVQSFEEYARSQDLPVRTGVEVTSLAVTSDGFILETSEGAHSASHVVIAAGSMNVPRVPALSQHLPNSIVQLNTGNYRSPGQLPDGAVVVIGGGQSGAQIVEELCAAGRTTYFATSKTGYLPRRYRGRDALAWMRETGFMDVAVGDLEDPAMQFATQPLISGTRNGHTVTLPFLARSGARLLGRVRDIEDGVIHLNDDLADNIAAGEEFANQLKGQIDEWIEDHHIEAPPPTLDPAEEPLDDVSAPTRLDLAEAGVTTVIWCTGFGPDFRWIGAPVFDQEGRPVHTRGVSDQPGLYFVGFPWLHSRKSGIIAGVDEDAGYIAQQIAAQIDERRAAAGA